MDSGEAVLAALPPARDGAGQGATRTAASGRRWLFAGFALFLIAKFAWILVPSAVMGVPRLGDDALVYLWSGVSTVAEPRLDRPAIRDIVQLRQEQAEPPPALEYARARVAMRTTGVTASPVAFLTGALLHAGADHKLAFALVEAAIALLLCVGIACCIGQLLGRSAAAVTLAALTFAILPNQGLHYLVPSVFVLSLALLLWTIVLAAPQRWLLAGLLSLAMLLTHTIGQVYVLAAAALLFSQALLRRRFERPVVASLLALAASVPVWLAINALTGVRAPMTTGLGGLSLAALPVNVAGLARHVTTLVLTQPVVFLLLVAGLVGAVRRRSVHPQASLLAGVLAAVVVSTVVIDIPGYPGELPSRALVGLVIVGVGIAAAWGLDLVRRRGRRAAWIAAAVALAWSTQLPVFAHYAIGNLNSRHQIYDPRALHGEIAALPSNAVVVWIDTDIALMAGLLAGADRLRAVPYSMLAKPDDLRSRIAGASPVYLATTAPERLNGTSVLEAWSLRPRFYGYGFDQYRHVILDATGTARLPGFIRIEGGDVAGLRVTGSDGAPCSLQPAAAGDPAWYRVAGCNEQRRLQLEAAGKELRVTGLAMREPGAACAWPWGEAGLRIVGVPRRPADSSQVDFSFARLLGEGPALALESQLGPLSVHSCRSGLIWLQAGAARAKP